MRKQQLHEGRKYAIVGYDRKAGALLTKIGSKHHTFIAPDDGREIRRDGRDILHEWGPRDEKRLLAMLQAREAREDIEARLAVFFEDIPPRERPSPKLDPRPVAEIKVHPVLRTGDGDATFSLYLHFTGREAVERVLSALEAQHFNKVKELTK